jgi:hypothetical protein
LGQGSGGQVESQREEKAGAFHDSHHETISRGAQERTPIRL